MLGRCPMSHVARKTMIAAAALAAAGVLGCHDPESPASFPVDAETGINGDAVGPDDVYCTAGAAGAGHLEKAAKAGGAPPVTLSEGGYALGYDGAGILSTLNGKGELLTVPTDGKSSAVLADQEAGTTAVAA